MSFGLVARERVRRALVCTVLLGLVLLGACAGAPEIALEEGNVRAARAALAQAAEKGPVRAVVAGELPGVGGQAAGELVSEAMSRGVSGLGVRFTPAPERAAAGEPHLAVVLNPRERPFPERVCAAPNQIATAPAGGEIRVLAAFCDGTQPIAFVRSSAEVEEQRQHRIERLLWRTAAELFPDDYEETYGFDLLPPWLDLQVGGSVGF